MSDALLTLLEQHLSEMAETMEKVREAGMLESEALAHVLEAIQKRPGVDLGPLVAAIANLRPVVNVTVPQAPVPAVHVMPAPASSWQIVRPGTHGRPDEVVATIRRVAP
jgi:hypothetical protein